MRPAALAPMRALPAARWYVVPAADCTERVLNVVRAFDKVSPCTARRRRVRASLPPPARGAHGNVARVARPHLAALGPLAS